MTEYVLVPREKVQELWAGWRAASMEARAANNISGLPEIPEDCPLLTAAPQPEAIAPQGNVVERAVQVIKERVPDLASSCVNGNAYGGGDSVALVVAHALSDAGLLSPPVGEGAVESLVEELTKFAHETVDALREAGSANWMANIALMTRLRRAIIARHSPSGALKEAPVEVVERIAKMLEDAAHIERSMASGGDGSEPGWYAADRFVQMAKKIRDEENTIALVDQSIKSGVGAAIERLKEALWLANRDKESVLKRIETEIQAAEALPRSGEINETLRDGRLGALRTLKEAFIEAGWIGPREASGLLSPPVGATINTGSTGEANALSAADQGSENNGVDHRARHGRDDGASRRAGRTGNTAPLEQGDGPAKSGPPRTVRTSSAGSIPAAGGSSPVGEGLDAEFENLKRRAANLGYELVRESEHPDSPHTPVGEGDWMNRAAEIAGRTKGGVGNTLQSRTLSGNHESQKITSVMKDAANLLDSIIARHAPPSNEELVEALEPGAIELEYIRALREGVRPGNRVFASDAVGVLFYVDRVIAALSKHKASR